MIEPEAISTKLFVFFTIKYNKQGVGQGEEKEL